jgi:hypothetical protein
VACNCRTPPGRSQSLNRSSPRTRSEASRTGFLCGPGALRQSSGPSPPSTGDGGAFEPAAWCTLAPTAGPCWEREGRTMGARPWGQDHGGGQQRSWFFPGRSALAEPVYSERSRAGIEFSDIVTIIVSAMIVRWNKMGKPGKPSSVVVLLLGGRIRLSLAAPRVALWRSPPVHSLIGRPGVTRASSMDWRKTMNRAESSRLSRRQFQNPTVLSFSNFSNFEFVSDLGFRIWPEVPSC